MSLLLIGISFVFVSHVAAGDNGNIQRLPSVVASGSDVFATHLEMYKKTGNFSDLEKTIDNFLVAEEGTFATASHAIILYRAAVALRRHGKSAKAYRYLRAAIFSDPGILGVVEEDSIKDIFAWIENGGNEEEKDYHRLFSAFVAGDDKALQILLPEIEGKVKKSELQREVQRIKLAHNLFIENSHAIQRIELKRQKASIAEKEFEKMQSWLAVNETASQTADVIAYRKLQSEIERINSRMHEREFDHNAFLAGGSRLHALGDLAGARMAFERALQIKPDLPEANYRLSRVFRSLRQKTEAARFAQRAVSSHPGEPRFSGFYALLLADQSDFSQSELVARSAIAVNALNGDARLALAMCHANSEDYENALKHIELGIKAGDPMLLSELTALKKQIIRLQSGKKKLETSH